MARLKDFELANLALWCLDFEKASDLYHGMVGEFGEKLDLLGTLGVVEGAILSNEMGDETWWTPRRRRNVDLKLEQEVVTPSSLYEKDKEDRTKRLKSLIASREKEILRKIQRHKKRLKDNETDSVSQRSIGDAARHMPDKFVSEKWFMIVQCFAWFCVGRGYRRDGMVPGLESLKEICLSREIPVESEDDRVLVVEVNKLKIEIWFDGRISCTSDAERLDEILPALRTVAAVYDEALAIG